MTSNTPDIPQDKNQNQESEEDRVNRDRAQKAREKARQRQIELTAETDNKHFMDALKELVGEQLAKDVVSEDDASNLTLLEPHRIDLENTLEEHQKNPEGNKSKYAIHLLKKFLLEKKLSYGKEEESLKATEGGQFDGDAFDRAFEEIDDKNRGATS